MSKLKIKRLNHKTLMAASAAALLGVAPAVQAASGTWTANTNGVWSAGGNWSGGTIADGAGSTADFSLLNVTGSTRVVTIDGAVASRTVGVMLIGDSNTTDNRAYSINTSGGGTLTFNNNLSNATLTMISTSAGDTIAAPVLLASSLDVTNLATGKLLTISASIGSSTSGAKTLSNLGSATGALTLSGIISDGAAGSIAIAQNDANSTLTINNVGNTYSGGTTVSAGTLLAQNSTNNLNTFLVLGTGGVSLNGGTLQIKANGSANGQTIITGNGTTGNSVSIGGTATIDLSSSGSFSGQTFVFNNLTLGNATQLNLTSGSADTDKFTGTTTLLGSAAVNATTAPLLLAAVTVDNTVATGTTSTLSLMGGKPVTISGSISNNSADATKKLALNVTASTVTLGASNTFSGGVTINSGLVNFVSGGLGGSAVNFAGAGTLQWASTQDISATNKISANSGVTGTIDVAANNVTFATANGLSGSGNITKAATTTGTLTLSAANDLSGIYTTSTTGGATILNNANALQSAVVNVAGANGITFGTGIGTFNLGGLSGAGALSLLDATSPTPAAIVLQLSGTAAGATSTSILTGAGASIVKVGSGTQSLGGASTFGGGVTIKAGTLIDAVAAGFGTGAIKLGDTTGTADATLLGGGVTIANAITVQAGSSGNTLTIGNSGASSTVLGGAVTMNRALNLAASNGGSVNFTGSITGGSNTLTISSTSGVVALSGANSLSGAVNLTGGTLNINSTTAIGTGTFTIGAGTTINSTSGNIAYASNNLMNWNGNFTFGGAKALTFGTGAVTIAAPLTLTVNGNVLTVNGAISGVGTNGIWDITKDGAGAFTYSPATTLSATRTLTVLNGTETLSGIISESSAGSGITVTGAAGTAVLSNANTFTGVVTIQGGAQVNAGSVANGGAASSLGKSTNAASNLVIDGGTLDLTTLSSSTDRLFTIGTGGATLQTNRGVFSNTGALAYTGSGARTLTLDTNASAFQALFAPVIADGAGGATKVVVNSGSGRWTLNNTPNNTYSGGTTVNGWLAVTGTVQSLGTGNVIVNAGGSLQIANLANLNTAGGAKVLVKSQGELAVGYDVSQSDLTTIVDGASSGGVLSLYGDSNHSVTGALDMSAIGDGTMYLSAVGELPASTAFTTTYTALTLGVGAGNLYRLGGGYGSGTLVFTHDVLANTTNGIQNNLVVGAPGTNAGTVQFLTNNSGFMGTITVNSGTLIFGNATGGSSGADVVIGDNQTLGFDSSTIGSAGITRAKSVTFGEYSTLNVTGNVNGSGNVNSTDVVTNALTFNSGFGIVTLSGGTATNWQLQAGSVAHNVSGVALFRGTNLGLGTIASKTANSANIAFTSAPTLVGGGGTAGSKNISIIPWAIGDTSASGGGSSFVTYDSNGVRPLASGEYDAAIVPNTTPITDNVSLALTTTPTVVTGAATVNSLYMTTTGAGVLSGTGALTITSGAVYANYGSTGITVSKTLDFGSTQAIIGTSNNTNTSLTLSGGITGTGGAVFYSSPSLPGADSGTFLGASTYTGNTYVLGNLQATFNTLPNFSNAGRTGDLYVYGRVELALSGQTGAGTITINGLNGSGFVTHSHSTTNRFMIGDNDANGTFSGTITSSGGVNVFKIGAGTENFTGTTSNWVNTTSIQNGTLSVVTLNSVVGGVASSSLGAPTTVGNGTIALGNLTTTGQLTVVGTGETTDRVINLAGTTGGGVLDQSGTGLLKFTSDFTATANGAKTLTLQGSTAGSGEIAGAIVDSTGKTSVAKAGSGTWKLSGTNTYTGTTTVSGGKLIAAASGALSTGNVSVVLGGVLELDNNASMGANSALNINVANGLDLKYASGTNESVGAITFGGQTFTSGTFFVGYTQGGTTYISGTSGDSITATPEPTSLALLGLGSIGLLARRRRRSVKA